MALPKAKKQASGAMKATKKGSSATKTTKKAGKAMKAMKAVAMKAMKAMKVKKPTKIARGRLAKAMVLKGKKEKTASGLTQESLMRNKRGKVVSKRASARGKRAYKQVEDWVEAVMAARQALHTKGFVAINGKTLQGKALYVKAKAIRAAQNGGASAAAAAPAAEKAAEEKAAAGDEVPGVDAD